LQSLRNDISTLMQHASLLKKQRFESPFANDIFEAVADWVYFGNSLIEEHPRSNFPRLACEEYKLLCQLQAIVSRRSLDDQRRCAPLFEAAERIIRVAEARLPPKDGYLGFLRVARQQFGFLESEHGFDIVDVEPTSIRFSSGKVYVELDCTDHIESSCSFGPESKPNVNFWLSNLLFLHDDQRYLDFREEVELGTEAAVERWFIFAAALFKQFGSDVIANAPGIFERLQEARDRRDRELTEENNRLYLPKL
jgi:hypothetical protein